MAKSAFDTPCHSEQLSDFHLCTIGYHATDLALFQQHHHIRCPYQSGSHTTNHLDNIFQYRHICRYALVHTHSGNAIKMPEHGNGIHWKPTWSIYRFRLSGGKRSYFRSAKQKLSKLFLLFARLFVTLPRPKWSHHDKTPYFYII